MKTTAAVLVELGKPLILAELDIPVLKPGQVLVEIAFSGICHTQVLECRGHRGDDPYLPHCLGHEGSGIVCDIGGGVTKVKVGERIILSWIKGSGADVPGTLYGWNSRSVNAGAITTFSRHAVVSENRLTPLPQNIAMRDATMLGCAVPTGLGTVFNTAQPRPGQGMAVFGMGGIGSCVLMGAIIAGCVPIIAVDVRQDKLKLAKKIGATHCVHAAELNPVEEIHRICPGGIDFAVEAIGRPGTVVQALHSIRNQGGTVVVIGNARDGEFIQLDQKQLNLGKRILGTWGGDNLPDRDYPLYCKLLNCGKFNLDLIMSRDYRLSEINAAINDLGEGKVVRPVVNMSME